MCGRYTLTAPGEIVAEIFELVDVPPILPRYNLAPTQEAAVVRVIARGAPRSLAPLRWGLVPYWATDPTIGNRMINARAESVAEKPAFRDSFRRWRCLVPADRFYEWQKLGPVPPPRRRAASRAGQPRRQQPRPRRARLHRAAARAAHAVRSR